jgi:Cadherin-like beta sandwich domain/Carboxypeptidase regulatory-like domain
MEIDIRERLNDIRERPIKIAIKNWKGSYRMKTRIICFLTAMALILPTLVGSFTGSAQAQTGGSFSGHIDNGTSPIIGWVSVWQVGPGNSSIYRGYTVAGGNGNYIFTGLPTGQYHILAQAYGYAAEWYDNAYDYIHLMSVEVTAPNNTANINFSLAPGGAISGHVQTASGGMPINGATILVYEYGKQTGYPNLCSVTSTNMNGNYLTPSLLAGDYAVQVKATSYATEWYSDTHNPLEAMPVHVTIGATTPSINFNLAPGASISGHIQDANTGAGIEGVEVLVVDYDLVSLLPDKFPEYDHVFTNQTGDYVVPGLAAGEYQVRILPDSSLGYARQTYGEPVAVTPPDNVSNLDFSLECGGSISGYVYQPDGTTPIERAQATIYHYNSSNAQWEFWTLIWTDMYGHYVTIGTAPDAYKVRITAEGLTTQWYNQVYNQAQATPVEISCSATTSGIDFVLVPPSTDATLSNLIVSQGTLTPAFAPAITSYSDSVVYSVTSVTVTPTVNESHATVTVNGTPVASGSPSGPISLSVGDNTMTIVVTAQDGTTTNSYILTVTRAVNRPPVIQSVTINPDKLWPPNGKPVNVNIAVQVTDPDGASDIVRTTFSVNDEYGKYNVAETNLPQNGIINLIAERDGQDKDGRVYTITITVYDAGGLFDSRSAIVTVPHDQSKK